jgi:hypothetical protein
VGMDRDRIHCVRTCPSLAFALSPESEMNMNPQLLT